MRLSTKWLSGMSNDWQVVNPKQIFEERSGKSLPSDIHLTPSQTYGVLPQSEYMEKTGTGVVLNLVGSDNMKHVEIDDFIIHLRSFQGGIEHSTFEGKVSNAYCVLKPKSGIEARFFRWVLKSSGYIQELNSTTNQLRDGQSIKFEQFASIGLPLPPLVEQRRIADYLDATCEYIDKAVTATNKLLISSEEILISKLGELFVEKPTPDFLLGKMGVSTSLFRAGIRGQAGQTPKSSEATFWTESGFGTPWLSISDLVSRGRIISSEKDVTDLGLMEIGMKPSEEETLLFAMYASMGKVSFAPPGFVWSQAILGLATGDVDKYFLAAWFEVARPHLKALARSSTQDNLNADQVMSLRIPVIARGEQTLIGKMYLSMVDEHLKRNMILEEQTRLLNELKVSLIAGAITGTFDLTSGRSVA